MHRPTQGRVTELYGRNGVDGSRGITKIAYSVYFDGFLTERKCRDAGICCQPGGLARRFWGTVSANGMPHRHRAINHRLMQWRVAELYGAQWRRRRRRCREDGPSSTFCGFLIPRSVGARPCPDFLTTNAHTSERNFLIQQFRESSVTPHLALPPRGVGPPNIVELLQVPYTYPGLALTCEGGSTAITAKTLPIGTAAVFNCVMGFPAL
jgi:hypothetical protein